MSDVICPQCGADSLVGLVAYLSNTYRCDSCGSMARMVVDKPKHEARQPHPSTQIGRGNG